MLTGAGNNHFSLAEVMPSALQSLLGRPNPLDLPAARQVIVFVVDGLGVDVLKDRSGHARTMARSLGKGSVAQSIFPSTTVSALSTIATGELPGIHGMIGYSSLDVQNDRVVRPLSNWDEKMDPAEWQLARTVFEEAGEYGISAHAVTIERFRHTGFTKAILRGAEFSGAGSVHQRAEKALELIQQTDPVLVYLYAAEFDHAVHEHGKSSAEALTALEEIDSAVRFLAANLKEKQGLIVTADHGTVDVPQQNQVFFDKHSSLLDGVKHFAGDPRAVMGFFHPDASEKVRESTISSWRDSESQRAQVVTRDEAIALGWFGPKVAEKVRPRIGDFMVVATKEIAYYDSRSATAQSIAMIGQHGSLSDIELRVPLIKLGCFAR